jgi:hypothetical protein
MDALEHIDMLGELCMANYYATARSNYFKVGKPTEFMDWLNKINGVSFEERDIDPEAKDMVGFLYCDDADGAGWPCYQWNEDLETDEDIDFARELAQFLAPDSVAILFEVGHEKLRYLVGYAVAVHHTGDIIQLALTDIYEKIKDEWGLTNINTEGV